MSGGRRVYITWDDGEVYFRGDHPEQMGLFVTSDGIEGWDSSPTAKVSMTEKATGDGSHAITDADVLYSSRVVTVNFRAHGGSRDEVLGYIRQVAQACHRVVKLRIVDGTSDLYCMGYSEHSIEAEWNDRWGIGTLTVTCPDPIRYSTQIHRIQISPNYSVTNGLSFGDGEGLVFPLSYGEIIQGAENIGTLHNSGTAKAYPVITVNGRVDGGFVFEFGQRSLSYSQPVTTVPLVLDSSTRIATIGDLDVSRSLTSRGWPELEPGGSLTVVLLGSGSGYADITWHDAYI